MSEAVQIHPTAVVEEGSLIGDGTRIWNNCHIRSGARIGADCSLGFGVFVDAGVTIGDRCKIQNLVSLYRGVTLEDEVFVGPSAVFTNDRVPRANPIHWEVVPTTVRTGASIGANATIVCGVELGVWSMVAAGAVVTSHVPAHALVVGIPARLRAWLCTCGETLAAVGGEIPARCTSCGRGTEGVG